MSAVICSECGGDTTVERVALPDGRQRFTLTCDDYWAGLVEYTRRESVDAWYNGKLEHIGYISVPA